MSIELFLLQNADDIQAFQNELYEKGLPRIYKLQYDTERYDEAIYPMVEMTNITWNFFLIVFAAVCGIIVLLNFLSLRERKYEIGVLRAIGMPKRNVSILLLGELTILTLSSALFALATCSFLSQPIADELIRLTMDDRALVLLQVISQIRVSVSWLDILEVFGVAIALVTITGFGFIATIMRFNPVKILSERN